MIEEERLLYLISCGLVAVCLRVVDDWAADVLGLAGYCPASIASPTTLF